MLENSLSVLLSRLDFAWITSMHILYPPLTIGLSLLLFVAEWRWVGSGEEHWYRLTRFFEKLFIINFGAGVATGVTMEMAFGILYGPFSQAAGPFFGNILGYETITAFMYEAGFVGLMIFGWGKIGKRMHLFATFNVMLSSSLSAMWILVANSWMQTPTGVTLKNGIFMVDNWVKAILNPDFLLAFPHMWIAALELALFFVAGISAWYLLKQRHVALFQRALKYALFALVVVAPLQIYLGDGLGRVVARDQPAALAALEGHYHTYNPDGSVNSGWHIVAWPNDTAGRNDFAITLPHVLSLLETHTLNGKVTGLDHFKADDRPPVLIPFYAFRLMVAIGFFLFAVALWGAYLALKGRLGSQGAQLPRTFLRVTVFSAFLPYAAVWTGWWTREIARQPWVVYGLMRTSAGVSKMSVGAEVLWLIGFIIFEMIVWGGAWYFFAKVVRKGPDMDSPVIEGGHEHLGHLEPPHEGQEQPEYPRPAY
ncbi:cytochrome ubiquinol oxidase subunit I [Acidihalobacter prosperus]|uniref:Cytochrome d ubiquinol oxidase subunit I n=1 Tax=Acidihalobacter prosperus TaxID=160660 RepID=A0A1A6C8R0_9GAMM|nr:cytochrome ubiquinol oxidase subunit I [Acidihalobacter prosperus]OBS10935.1 cytochrome d ubiquinol oxidase subunit I [Acidihalobacter prosperus]